MLQENESHPKDLLTGLLTQVSGSFESLTLQEYVTANNANCTAPTDVQSYGGCADIVQQGKVYHVSFDIDLFNPTSNADRAFLIWLYSRQEGETIYLSLVNLFPPYDFSVWVNGLTPLFQALIFCKANVVGLVEGPTISSDAYVLMACNQLQFGPYALVTVQPVWTTDSGGLSSEQQTRRALVYKLYERGIGLGLITEEMVAMLTDGRQVTVTVAHPE